MPALQVMGFQASIILPTATRINQQKKRRAFSFEQQGISTRRPTCSETAGLADDDLTDSKTLDRNLQKRTTIQMSKKNKETRRQIGEEGTGPIGREKRLTRDNGTKREWSTNPTGGGGTGDGRTAAERPRSSRKKEQQQQGGEASEGRPPRNLVELSYYSSGSGTEADESSIREWLINLRLSSPAGVAGFREDGRTDAQVGGS